MMNENRNCGAARRALLRSLPAALLGACAAALTGPAAAQDTQTRNAAAAPMPASKTASATRSVARADPGMPETVHAERMDRAAQPEKPKRKWDEHHGLFGPIRFGPVVGTGIPNLRSIGATSKLWGLVGLGFNYGSIPDMQVSFYGDATVRYRQMDAYARVYPFRGGFYLGSGFGYHSVKGTHTNRVEVNSPVGKHEFSIESEGSVRSMIVTPQLGYFRNFDFGLALGFGIGAQIPVAPSEVTYQSRPSPSVPTEVVQAADKQVVDTLRTIGRTPLPQVEVRAGWLF
jgi:hypothetical protein